MGIFSTPPGRPRPGPHALLGMGIGMALLATACKGPGAVGPSPRTGKSPTAASPRSPALPLALDGSPRVIGDGAELLSKIRLLPDGAAADMISKIRLIPLAEATTLLSKIRLVSVNLTGKVKLISDISSAIISNNSAGVVGNQSAKYRSALATDSGTPPPESLLADAALEVLDASGHVLVDADLKPISASSDDQGVYHFSARLPQENLILRVRLAVGGKLAGGQLLAMLASEREARPSGVARSLDLDTASSLGAAYVLERYVQGSATIYDRLPGEEAAMLQRDLEAARGHLGARVDYMPQALARAADDLRRQDATVDRTLARIQALLLAGQRDLGNGLVATSVGLAFPTSVTGDETGNLYIGETASARIRRVGPDGRISVVVGPGAKAGGGAESSQLETIGAMVRRPDGALIVTQMLSGKLRAITPEGGVSALELTGAPLPLVRPSSLALAPDGTLYVGEVPGGRIADPGRILSVSPTGVVTVVPTDGIAASPSFSGLGVQADGTLVALEWISGKLMRRAPGGPWQVVADGLNTDEFSRLRLEPDGTIFVSETPGHRVRRVSPDGVVTTFAGTGLSGTSGDGGAATAARLDRPTGLWKDGGGTLYIADGQGLVRAVRPDGTISTVAGTTSPITGNALTIAVNSPVGMDIDLDGRLVIAEAGSHTLKRLEGQTLVTIAGSDGSGYDGDGGPATAAHLDTPGGLVFGHGKMWFVDGRNHAIRQVDERGIIHTVASRNSSADLPPLGPGMFRADSVPMGLPWAVAVSPTGQVYWSDAKTHRIFRLVDADVVELVAGVDGRSGNPDVALPARESPLNTPLGLAFDAKGDLYVAAAGNNTILRLEGGDPARSFTIVAGLTITQLAGRLEALRQGAPPDVGGTIATESILFVPTCVAFDVRGHLYTAELGTNNLAAVVSANPLTDALVKILPRVGPRIRRISPDGAIQTVAGDGTALLNDPANDDFMVQPLNLVVNREGGLVIADSGLNQVKVIPAKILEAQR